MLTRRMLLMLPFAAAAPKPKLAPTGGLFNPKANIAKQYYGGVVGAPVYELWPTPKAGEGMHIRYYRDLDGRERIEAMCGYWPVQAKYAVQVKVEG